MKSFRVNVMAAVAFVVMASSASGQSVGSDRAGIVRQNLVSANPIGLLFEWYNGEYERAVSSVASLAVAASSFSEFDIDGDSRYSVVDGIARYYPGGRAIRGFSVGASLGLVSFNDDNEDCAEFGCPDESGTGATLGIRADYVWIIGRDQHFAAAAGVGAKRVLSDDIGTEGLPIARLSIGYAW